MGRASSIEQLPPELLEQLQAWLRDPRVTQLDAVDRVNAVVDQVNAGLGEDEQPVARVSKSALNRYAQRMEAYGEKIRQAREISQMWIGRLGAEPAGQMGNMLTEFIRTLSFDLMFKLEEIQEAGLDPDQVPSLVAQLKDMAITAQRLEKASSENVKRDAEIKKQAREEAAAAAETAVRQAGLSDDGVAAMRDAILEGL